MFHSVYGLRLRTNLPVPGLGVLPSVTGTDVSLWLGSRPARLNKLQDTPETLYVSPNQDDRGEPSLIVRKLSRGAYFQFHYADSTEFVLDRRGTKIWATWPETLTLDDAATYLLGPVLGFVLRLRGVICLHASAVAIDGAAVAFVGPSGAGKSTTAAAFAGMGYPVLSDDVVALVEEGTRFFVQPAYPRVCLWPDAVGSLYASPEALPRLTPNWDKRYLDLNDNGHRFQQRALPLAGIYFLDERSGDLQAPRIEAVVAGTGLMSLVANTYVNYLLDQRMRAQEFDLLGRLVTRIPLRRVFGHQDPACLKLCHVILDDFCSRATLPSSRA